MDSQNHRCRHRQQAYDGSVDWWQGVGKKDLVIGLSFPEYNMLVKCGRQRCVSLKISKVL